MRALLLAASLGVATGSTAVPLPTPAQLRWSLHGTACFVHYNMATMVGSQGCQSGTAAPPPLSDWQPCDPTIVAML